MPPLTHIHSHTGIIHTSTQYHANYDKTGGLGLCFDEIKLSSVETEISQFRSTAKKTRVHDESVKAKVHEYTHEYT
jgi:hypothetical protein